MNAAPRRWRRLALLLAQHAASVLPGASSPWAEAMRRELDYVGDDPAAVRWALGCIVASYRVRLAQRPSVGARPVAWRLAATSAALLLLIGLALQDHAGGQTEPPRPAFDETTCDRPDGARPATDRSAQPPDPSCVDRIAPARSPHDHTPREANERVR
jgi:hypothetical protein